MSNVYQDIIDRKKIIPESSHEQERVKDARERAAVEEGLRQGAFAKAINANRDPRFSHELIDFNRVQVALEIWRHSKRFVAVCGDSITPLPETPIVDAAEAVLLAYLKGEK